MTGRPILVASCLVLCGLLCDPSAAFCAKAKKRTPKRPPPAVESEEKPSTATDTPPDAKPEEKPEAIGPKDVRTGQENPEQTREAQEPNGSKEKVVAEEDREMEAEEAQRLTELFLRNQSVFIHKGELMVELNTFYNRNSRNDFLTIPGGGGPTGQEHDQIHR